MLQILAHRIYRNLFAAQVAALLGTGIMTVALSLLAYQLAGGDAGAVLGTALALKMVAYVGVAPLAGAVAHRFSRRTWLVILDVVRGAVVACLPFVDQVWQIYVLIFALSACSAASTPVFQAAIPDVLHNEDDYTQALSLSRLAYELENLLSPALAAGLLSLIGFHWLFVGTAAGFFASALLVGAVSLPSPRCSEQESGFITRLTGGLRTYLATPRLRGLLALNLAVAAAGAMIIVNTVVYVRTLLGGGDQPVAWAFTAAGAGAAAAALLLPQLVKRCSDRRIMLTGTALLGAGLLGCLASPGLAGLLALWLVLGAGSSLVQTPTGRLLRRSGDESGRQGLFTAQFALSHACWLIAYPLAGWLGAAFGMTATFSVLAGVAMIAALVAVKIWPAGDAVVLEHEHAPLTHEHRHVHDAHHQHAHEGWEGPEPHAHPHRHVPLRHCHPFVIDLHHPVWPPG
jgi:MFS family permease